MARVKSISSELLDREPFRNLPPGGAAGALPAKRSRECRSCNDRIDHRTMGLQRGRGPSNRQLAYEHWSPEAPGDGIVCINSSALNPYRPWHHFLSTLQDVNLRRCRARSSSFTSLRLEPGGIGQLVDSLSKTTQSMNTKARTSLPGSLHPPADLHSRGSTPQVGTPAVGGQLRSYRNPVTSNGSPGMASFL